MTEKGSWTKESLNAKDFRSLEDGYNHCRKKALKDCQLSLRLSGPDFETTISLEDAKHLIYPPARPVTGLVEKPKTYKVLIADDSENDHFLLRRALLRFPRFNVAAEFFDGNEIISYLSDVDHKSERNQRLLPELLLLDLKMPLKNGFDVLKWLSTQRFSNLTVVVLSGSEILEDIQAARALGANGFYTKTVNPRQQDQSIREIETLLDHRWTRPAVDSPSSFADGGQHHRILA